MENVQIVSNWLSSLTGSRIFVAFIAVSLLPLVKGAWAIYVHVTKDKVDKTVFSNNNNLTQKMSGGFFPILGHGNKVTNHYSILSDNVPLSKDDDGRKLSLPLSIQDISEAMKSAPLLSKIEVGQRFVHRQIQWSLLLGGAKKINDNNVNIWAIAPSGTGQMVSATVSLMQYPEIKTASKHAPIQITGRISKISTMEINLEDANIKFGH